MAVIVFYRGSYTYIYICIWHGTDVEQRNVTMRHVNYFLIDVFKTSFEMESEVGVHKEERHGTNEAASLLYVPSNMFRKLNVKVFYTSNSAAARFQFTMTFNVGDAPILSFFYLFFCSLFIWRSFSILSFILFLLFVVNGIGITSTVVVAFSLGTS